MVGVVHAKRFYWTLLLDFFGQTSKLDDSNLIEFDHGNGNAYCFPLLVSRYVVG